MRKVIQFQSVWQRGIAPNPATEEETKGSLWIHYVSKPLGHQKEWCLMQIFRIGPNIFGGLYS